MSEEDIKSKRKATGAAVPPPHIQRSRPQLTGNSPAPPGTFPVAAVGPHARPRSAVLSLAKEICDQNARMRFEETKQWTDITADEIIKEAKKFYKFLIE